MQVNNTPTFTIVGGSVSGCDSIVTLDLTINNVVLLAQMFKQHVILILGLMVLLTMHQQIHQHLPLLVEVNRL
jgi:hypothetical protein